MKEGKKIYSLIAEAADGKFYQMKVGDDYSNSLARIDDYTCSYACAENMNASFSYFLDTEIVNTFIRYKNDKKSKTLKPVFGDMDFLKRVAEQFGTGSEICKQDRCGYGYVYIFAKKLMNEYYTNKNVYNLFEKYGDYLVVDALKKRDVHQLIYCLCKYRNLRNSIIIMGGALKGEEISPLPEVKQLPEELIKSEERLIENIDKQIFKYLNNNIIDEKLKIQSINQLYESRSELEESLNRGSKVGKQMRLF